MGWEWSRTIPLLRQQLALLGFSPSTAVQGCPGPLAPGLAWPAGVPQPCLPSAPRKVACPVSILDPSFMLSSPPCSLELGGRTLLRLFFGANKCSSALLLPAYVSLLMSTLVLHNSPAPSRRLLGTLCPARAAGSRSVVGSGSCICLWMLL